MKTLPFIVPLAVFSVLILGSSLTPNYSKARAEADPQQSDTPGVAAHSIPDYHLHYLNVFDTIWVLGDVFIEISLKDQLLSVHRREADSVTSYKVSSGNKYVEDGMETPDGLYSVQSKSPLAISRQYDDAKMFHWIGFNYNIGCHGLEGRGYYRYLGKRPSSHGCIRMAREDIKEMYPQVAYGTPVIVYKEEPARKLFFADPATFDTSRSVRMVSRRKKNTAVRHLLARRLERLYSGRLFVEELPQVYFDGQTQLRPGGYDVGQAELIPSGHERPMTFAALLNYSVVDRFDYLQPHTDHFVPADEFTPAVDSSLIPQQLGSDTLVAGS